MPANHTRREFVRALVSVPVVGLFWPKALIGDPAGGFYVPVPDDLTPYLYPIPDAVTPYTTAPVRQYRGFVAWAAPGDRYAQISEYRASMVVDKRPEIVAAQEANAMAALRHLLQESHRPGWFKAHRAILDANGEYVASEDRWTRIVWLKYLEPHELLGVREMTIAS